MNRPHFRSNDVRLPDFMNFGGVRMLGAEAENYAGFNFGFADVNGDGFTDLLVCADGFNGGGIKAGGAFIVYGKSGMDPTIDFGNLAPDDGFIIQGEFATDLASRMLSSAGDINGDGIDDMLIGAFKNDEGGTDSGAAYLVYGSTDSLRPTLDLYDLPLEVGIKIVGEAADDYASFWVASAGDLNNDGINDIVIGAPQNDAGGNNSGAAYVIFGRISNFTGAIELATLDLSQGFKITGATPGDITGLAVSPAGDFNGDGTDDLLVSAPQDGQSGSGRVYVIYGSDAISTIDLSALTSAQGLIINGEAASDAAGFTVAGVGDVNGDGIDDILVGATRQDSGGTDAGAAYIIYGKSSGFGATFDLSTLDGTNGFKITGAAAGDRAGTCVSAAGDFNGDGFNDFLIGSEYSSLDGTNSGVAYLLFGGAGPRPPVIQLSTLSATDGLRFRGEGPLDLTGRAVSAAGDMDGDGYDDIAIGLPGNAANGVQAGAAYIVFGRPDNDAPVANDSLVTLVEDTLHIFTQSDFGFSDAYGDNFAGIFVTSLPDRGNFRFVEPGGSTPGRALVVGEFISVEDLNAGRLSFQGWSNESGESYAFFTFSIKDDGGTVGQGQDTSLTFAKLTLSLTADPSDIDNVYGTNANDVVQGTGRSGTLNGLAGDDIYLVTLPSELAIESVGQGYDTVRASGSYELAQGSSIERLEASNPLSVEFLGLIGNELDNYIRGNNGINGIRSNGGADILEGLGGDDSYLLVSGTETIIEAANGGYDTVYTTVDYVLTAGAHVEAFTAYERDSLLPLNLTGNERDNIIYGTRGNNILNGGGGKDTIYGGIGNDTYHVDSANDLPFELFGEGYDTVLSSVNYTLPQGMELELLSHSDVTSTNAVDLTGNKIRNTIIGNLGANLIDGGGGGDLMQGLGGDDTYIVRNAADRVIEVVGGGNDRVRTLVDFAAGSSHIERIEAFDSNATTALRLTGNGIDNVIIGNAGENGIIGGAGADILQGLGGNDGYIVSDSRALVLEAVGGGRDTVYTTTDFTLSAGSEIEVLTVYDRATSNAINLTGNEFANTIYGNAGGNTINGGGGNDILYGLGGNDTYIVRNANDRVEESVGGGVDRVLAIVSYVIAAGIEIESLEAFDAASTTTIELTGNAFASKIIGNLGANLIDGGGGGDLMQGLGGDDTYIVRNAADRVIEVVGGGNDRVRTLVDFAAGSSHIERIEAFDSNATTALRLTGNGMDNVIIGNAGENGIIGGAGADILQGLGGNDGYIVSDSCASVLEAVGGGRDTVYTTTDFTLSAGSEIEVLTVYDRATSNAINLTGNEFANTIYGNAGGNTINGGGGNDILYGLGGNDVFLFDETFQFDSIATIMDFAVGSDQISISSEIVGNAPLGNIAPGSFHIGTAAADADDRFIYDQVTGRLYYDSDGTGAEAAIQFASFNPGLALSAENIFII